jgi:hypothetical protein
VIQNPRFDVRNALKERVIHLPLWMGRLPAKGLLNRQLDLLVGVFCAASY